MVIPAFFDQLTSYNEKLEKYNANLIVQGSYADATYLSYSDVDLVIIGYLSKEIIKIKKSLLFIMVLNSNKKIKYQSKGGRKMCEKCVAGFVEHVAAAASTVLLATHTATTIQE